MTRKLLIPFAIATLAFAAGCSDPTPSDDVTGDAQGEESAQPGETSADDEAANDPGEAEESQTSAEDDDDRAANSLTIAVGSDEVDFEPTDVYCTLGDRELQHLIAKTNNQPPLLELTPGEFAMVKLGKSGAPEKTNSPSGIEYDMGAVTFTEAQIGNATVDGRLECTEIESE